MESVRRSVIDGEPVFLRGFGSFVVKQRAEKTARNISKERRSKCRAQGAHVQKPARVFVGEHQAISAVSVRTCGPYTPVNAARAP